MTAKKSRNRAANCNLSRMNSYTKTVAKRQEEVGEERLWRRRRRLPQTCAGWRDRRCRGRRMRSERDAEARSRRARPRATRSLLRCRERSLQKVWITVATCSYSTRGENNLFGLQRRVAQTSLFARPQSYNNRSLLTGRAGGPRAPPANASDHG